MVCQFFDKESRLLVDVILIFRFIVPNRKTVFAQIMDLVLDYELGKCIDKYKGDYKTKKFTCRDQFMAMNYAQFTRSPGLSPSTKSHHNKRAFKMHTLMELRCSIPTFIWLTESNHVEQNLYIISQAIRLILFERAPLSDIFNLIDNSKLDPDCQGQLSLF